MKSGFLPLLCGCAALFAGCAALFAGCASLSKPKLVNHDAELRQAITGVWFSEQMPNPTMHIAARYQYYPDGRYLADYRISHEGSEQYKRMLGRWEVKNDVFGETVAVTSDPSLHPPPLLRRVPRIDAHTMLAQSMDNQTAVELTRSPAGLSAGSSFSLNGFDRQRFLEEAEQLRMAGFVPTPVPGKPGVVSWPLVSRMSLAPSRL